MTMAIKQRSARRRSMKTWMGLAAAGAAAAFFGGATPAAAHGTHYDCQVHDFRPYPHRHIDPGAAVVNCNRPAITGRYATAAVCETLARRRGGTGRIVPGTQTASAVPVAGRAPANVRAAALNQACQEAVAACSQTAINLGAGGAACQVIDRRFAR